MGKEEITKINENIESVLKVINRANETFTYSIWIPSLDKEVLFREINTSQQKRLIKAVIDSPVYNTEFIFTMKQIINENCTDSTIKIDDLTIIDKMFIALKMRSVSMSDEVEIEFKNKQKKTFSIEQIIENARSKLKIPAAESFEMAPFTVTCSVPTIGTEHNMEKEFRSHVKEIEIKDKEELRNTIGDVFIGEIVKYINTLSIQDNENIHEINMNETSFRNRITLIEKLPVKLIEQVMKYAKKVGDSLSVVTLIKAQFEDDDGKVIDMEEKLSIDGSFFINS